MNSQKIFKFFLSFFGVGHIKYAPGTFGSLATLPLIYIISLKPPSLFSYLLFTIALIIISIIVTEIVQKRENIHDPSWIVIDEVIGMLICWISFYPKFEFNKMLILFGLFRFFDIVKIWPANYFDKKVYHGFGTIIDDVISGIYVLFVLHLLQKFI